MSGRLTTSGDSPAVEASYPFRPWRSYGSGAHKDDWGARRQAELVKHLQQYEVVWANDELVRTSARLRSQRRSAGRELTSADAWIAATALLLGCPLAAHDGDFADIPDLDLIRCSQVI